MRAAMVLVAALAVACSSAPAKTGAEETALAGGRCGGSPHDSIYTALSPAYRDCAVTVKAVRLRTTARPDWTPPRGGREACYYAELEYVVGADGLIERTTARMVRTNNQALADAMLAFLVNIRYQPAALDGVPVRQIMTDKTIVAATVVRLPAGTRPSASTTSSRPPSTATC